MINYIICYLHSISAHFWKQKLYAGSTSKKKNNPCKNMPIKSRGWSNHSTAIFKLIISFVEFWLIQQVVAQQVVCSRQYVVPSRQYVVGSIQYLVCIFTNIKHTRYYILPTTYYVLPTRYYILCTTYYILCTTYYIVKIHSMITVFTILGTRHYLLDYPNLVRHL